MFRIRRILQLAGPTLALAILSVGGFGPAAASAAAPVSTFGLASASSVCSGINQVGANDCSASSNGGVTDNSGGSGVTGIIQGAVTILSYIAGAVAIIMIIIAGFKYMTSSGDSNKVSSAKSTLIYAFIGVAIAVLAQFIVHFAISSANGVQ